MSTRLTRLRRPLAVAAVLATGALGSGAACAATATVGSTGGAGVHVSDAETVQVYMDPTGKLGMQHVYEQLVLTGHGKADLANPIETSGLRNLDGFSGVSVKDGKQVVDTTVDGEKALRTVSNFHGKLPLTVTMSYKLDGKTVQPKDIVGKSGHLEVSYTVENVSGVPTTLTFDDGKGGKVTKTESVPIPMVGSLSIDTPDTFRNVASKQASMGGDGHGGTMMQFTLTLLPPIGPAKATFGYSADIKDGVLPRAELNALPVDPLTSPSFSGAASSYKGGADTGIQLTGGAMQMDAGLVKLRGGASDLVAGLIKLHDGAGQLSDGLKTSAVPGANKLADGTTQLDDGGKQLKSGADQLNGGLQQLKSKAPELGDGVKQIYAGQKSLADGLTQLYNGVASLPDQVRARVNADVNYQFLTGTLFPRLLKINADGKSTVASVRADMQDLSSITGLSVSDQSKVDKVTSDAADGGPLAGLSDDLGSSTNVVNLITSQLPGMVDQITTDIKDQLTAALGTPAKGCDPTKTLRCGAAALVAGGKQLNDAVPQLTKGVNQLAAGSDKLAAGAGDLSDGLGQANDGAHQLASGLGDAASGAGQIHDGLGTAADGAPQLVDGAKQLSVKGSQKIAEAGESTAQSYGEMYAELVAGAKRANTESMAVGAPAGATALTAYDYIITGADGQGGRNASRSLLAGGVLVAGGGGLLLRRRFGA
jgi:putative membrane protein